MTLKRRLLMIVVVPLAATIAFALAREIAEIRHLIEERAVAQKIRLSAEISDLIHQLQRERGFSAGFVSSGGVQFRRELSSQRSETDNHLRLAEEALGVFKAADISTLNDYESEIASLQQMRTGVSRLSVTTPEMAAYYTQVITHLIVSLEAVVKRVKEPKVIEAARVFGALIVAKEKAGLERAMGAIGFSTGRFSPELLVRFATYAGGEETLISEAAVSSDPRVSKIFADLIASDEHKALQRLRDLAPISIATGELGGVSGPAWFKVSSAWVDRVQAAEFELRILLNETSSEVISEATFSVIFGAFLTLSITLAASIWAYKIAGKLERETEDLSSELKRVAEGDLAERPETPLSTPEFSEIKEMAKVFRQTALDRIDAEAERRAQEKELNEVVDKVSAGLAKLAKGDLEIEISQPFTEQYDRLRTDFNNALQKLKALIGDVSEGMNSLDHNANAVKVASSKLATRTETQAATLDASSQSARELRSLVKETAKSASKTEQFADETRGQAESGAQVVNQAIVAMNKIENSSTQISSVVEVIEDIAFQTNLLALNAGVEAARAGEAGRGFAIVASEVRNLAQRVAGSAQEIKDLIANSSKDVVAGVDLVRQTGSAFDQIVTGVTKINGLISEISGASHNQADAVAGLTSSIEEIDETTQSNAAIAQEMTAAAATLFEETLKVNKAADVFNSNGKETGLHLVEDQAA